MGTLRIFIPFLFITGNQLTLCMEQEPNDSVTPDGITLHMEPEPNSLALDNIVLWEDLYLKDPCELLDRRLITLNDRANRGNLHGVFLQLFYITKQSTALKKAYNTFYLLNQQQNTLAECYPYLLTTFRFIHKFLRKISNSLSFFSDSQPLQQLYLSQKLDWAEPLIQLSCSVYKQIDAINQQYSLDRDDQLLCTEQQEELARARERSPAYALDFY